MARRSKRPRLNLALRWGGAALALAILALLIVSRWWIMSASFRVVPNQSVSASVGAGRSLVAWNSLTPSTAPSSPRFTWHLLSLRTAGSKPSLDWGFGAKVRWIPARGFARGAVMRTVTVPLWFLFLIPAAISADAWRRRPRPPGVCDCGYDLSGLPPGSPCPECAWKP
jgi:hypothetical protein